MENDVIDIQEALDGLTEQWSPRVIARMNDADFKVARLKGDFVWHAHQETDEAFLVIDGELRIDFRGGSVELKAGELLVVPRGVEHKPFAAKECSVLLVERAGTVSTGDAGPEPDGDRVRAD